MAAHLCAPSRVELLHQLDEVVVKLNQGWNNRLDCPPTKLLERYIRNELSIGLEIQCEQRSLIAAQSRDCVRIQASSESGGNDPCACANAQSELSVFVDDIHLVKDEERTVRRVGGVVRLKRFDKTQNPGVGDSLYFSFVSLRAVFI